MRKSFIECTLFYFDMAGDQFELGFDADIDILPDEADGIKLADTLPLSPDDVSNVRAWVAHASGSSETRGAWAREGEMPLSPNPSRDAVFSGDGPPRACLTNKPKTGLARLASQAEKYARRYGPEIMD